MVAGTVDITTEVFQDTFIIHFGVTGSRINAYTLASTLSSIADAAKAANAQINPGFDIEVVVEALGDGCFKATLRSIFHPIATSIFSKEAIKNIVWGVIAGYITSVTCSGGSVVTINNNYTVIQYQGGQVTMPKETYDYCQQMGKVPKFRDSVGQVFKTADSDPDVASISIGGLPSNDDIVFEVPRKEFGRLAATVSTEVTGDNQRIIKETTEVQYIKAYLETKRRKSRKWGFVWRGKEFSAPMKDAAFWRKFMQGRIPMRPGDVLVVVLAMHQERLDPDANIWLTKKYEILEVLDHIQRSDPEQLVLHGTTP